MTQTEVKETVDGKKGLGPLKFRDDQRREYLNMADRIGVHWLDIFKGNPEFYSADYWDLLTGLWRQDRPVRKTDAMKMMKGIKSAQTAGKYVEAAIKHKFLREEENPQDARSKLLVLAPDLRRKLDWFFDQAVSELCQSARTIESKNTLQEPF